MLNRRDEKALVDNEKYGGGIMFNIDKTVNVVLILVMVAVLSPWFFTFTNEVIADRDISGLMAFFIRGYPVSFIIASLIFCWLIITNKRTYRDFTEFFAEVFLPMVIAVPLSVVIYSVVVDVIENVGASTLMTILLYLLPYAFVLCARTAIMRGLFRR